MLTQFLHWIKKRLQMENFVLGSHFIVEWSGSRVDCTEIIGLSLQRHFTEYRDGASKDSFSNKIPGNEFFQNIVLRRALKKSDREMYDWWNEAALPNKKRDVVIKLLDETHQPVFAWALRQAFPVRISYAPLQAQSHHPVMEEVELAFDSIVLLNI